MHATGPTLTALALTVGAALGVPAVGGDDRPEVGENLLGGLRLGLSHLGAEQRALAGVRPGPVPAEAEGTVRVVAPPDVAPPDRADVRTVRVQVEDGLPVDGEAFAAHVLRILNDERGWGHDGSVGFAPAEPRRAADPEEVDPEREGDGDEPDVVVTLASPALVDELCAPLRTMGEYSCAINGTAVINAARWADGAAPFLDGGGSVAAYRSYLVNHEVGHLLGNGHTPCPGPDRPAPVMLQQSMRLEGCAPNGWPAHEDGRP